MKKLFAFLAACSFQYASTENYIAACGVPADKEPALDDCSADCYNAARCIEITGRLLYPQPGEADGKIYSNLDVCLDKCQ